MIIIGGVASRPTVVVVVGSCVVFVAFAIPLVPSRRCTTASLFLIDTGKLDCAIWEHVKVD